MTGSGNTGMDGDRDGEGRDGIHGEGHGHDAGPEDVGGDNVVPGTDEPAGHTPDAPDDDAAGIEWREGPELPPARPSSDFGAAADEPEQLSLGDDDVRLPWLEAGDDDEAETGTGAGQLLGMVVLGLLALGLIVGAIWWATRRQADDTLVADGSVITAPDQPYKERPKDPGGKTFAGTGDTSFAVSEGQTRTTRLDTADAKPGFASVPKPSDKPAAGAAGGAAAAGAAQPAAAGGVGVQVGAFSSKATAEAGWSKLQQQYSVLSGHSHRVVEGKADIGTVYRLQALAADAGAARTLCGQLRSAGLACQVKN